MKEKEAVIDENKTQEIEKALGVGESEVQLEDKSSIGVEEEPETDKGKSQEELQKEIEKFKANPDNRKKAIELATSLEQITTGKWFSIRQLEKRVKEPGIVLFQKLKLLQLFELCTAKKWNSSKHHTRGEMVFRVTLNKESQIISYRNIIDDLKSDIEYYEKKIKELEG